MSGAGNAVTGRYAAEPSGGEAVVEDQAADDVAAVDSFDALARAACAVGNELNQPGIINIQPSA